MDGATYVAAIISITATSHVMCACAVNVSIFPPAFMCMGALLLAHAHHVTTYDI